MWCRPLCRKSDSYRHMGLCLLFYLFGLCDFLCVSSKLVLLWWLCNIFWNQVPWYLWHCHSCSGLVWILSYFVCFYTHFSIFLSSLKNVSGILVGILLNLYIPFGNMAILTLLILPTHETLLVSSVWFLNTVFYNFLLYRRWYPHLSWSLEFLFFKQLWMDSFSNFFLDIHFWSIGKLFCVCVCVLILYPVTLLNLFKNLRVFW